MEQSANFRTVENVHVPLTRYLATHKAALLLGVMLLLAFFSRFWDLGSRALHHDETLHALYSFYLYDRGEYVHDPLMHGPILFHLTALGYWLFGVSDYTSRLLPAILGVILVWLPWKFRRWLGPGGALAASALILISPTLLYYSRFIRHDIFLAVWTVVIVYGIWAYLEEGEDFHLYVVAAGWALAFSQKEVSFLVSMVFWVFLALLIGARLLNAQRGRGPKVRLGQLREWHLLVMTGALLLPLTSALVLHVLGADPANGYNAATYRDPSFLVPAGRVVLALFLVGFAAAAYLWDGKRFLIAAGVFYGIFVLFHTTFLTSPWGVASGLVGALGYWIEQHGVERGGQPWYYYSMLTPLYEFLPLLFGVIGGSILLWKGRLLGITISHEEGPQPSPRVLWPFFNLWWLATIFFALSYAGEKMPWLLVHIALPLAFLGGWVIGKLLERVEWGRVWNSSLLLFGGLTGLAVLAALGLFWMAFGSQWPFQGTEIEALRLTLRWLGSLAVLVVAAWGTWTLRARFQPRTAGTVALLSIALLLAAATVRFAVIASFINADVPNEPLIYTQTAPDVPHVMRQIETISERLTGGKELEVAYDNDTLWPFEWYLRDYPNKFYYADNPTAYADGVRGAVIVLAGPNNDHKVRPMLPGYIRHHYSMRPNFPEDYKDLMQVTIVEADPNNPGQTISRVENQPSNVPNLLRNILEQVVQPQARADFLDFIWNRRMQNPLGKFDFYVYVQPEVASKVWQYGLTVATMDPELTRDPLVEAQAAVAPEVVLDGGGALQGPKDVAVLPDGQVAVADSGNHRVVLLDAAGAVVRSIGEFGTGEGQFNEPWGIAAAPDGTLYVADTWNHRVQHLDQEGNILHVWGSFADTGGQLGEGGVFWGPRDVAVDEAGRVYVSDTGNKRVQVFEADGTFVGQFGGGGAGAGQLEEPVGVAVAPDGTIWVADTWNRRVQRFDQDFAPSGEFAVRAWEGQNVTNKPYLAVSGEQVWVSDAESYRIIEYSQEGALEQVWGPVGEAADLLNLPFGLAWDGQRLWVADSENQRVVGY